MTKPLKILIVEDSASDAGLVARHIERSGYELRWQRVDSATDLKTALDQQPWDVIICDYTIPDFNGTDALTIVRTSGHDMPFIFVSGTMGEDVAVEAMKAGAHDYVVKGRLTRLVPAIERELREANERRAHKQAEAKLRLQGAALAAADNAIVITDVCGAIVWVNDAFTTLTGYTLAEAVGNNLSDLVKSGQQDRAFYDELWTTILAGRVWHGELVNRRKDGGLYSEEQTITPVRDVSGAISHFIAIKQDLTRRKLAERRLTQERQLGEVILNHMPGLFYLVAEDGTLLRWNRQLEIISGYSATEIASMSPVDFFGEADKELIASRFQQVFAEGQVEVVAELLTKSGERLPYLLTGALVVVDGQRCLAGAGLDISERERVAKAMRESEAKYRGLFETARDAIMILEPRALKFTSGNPVTLRMFQARSEEEFLALGPEELSPARQPDGSDSASRAREMIAMALDTGSHAFEWVHRRIGGEEFPADVCLTRMERDGKLMLQATVRDLTERKRAEAEQRLQSTALVSAANEILITGRAGVIEWVNPAFTKTTGYTLEESVGQNPRFLQSGKHEPEFYKNLWATILRGEVWHGEFVNRRKDRSLFTELATITPVKDERGAITHFVAIKQDITEKKVLEAKFLRAQRLEGLGALAGGVAHDLNNVLAPILMCAEILRGQTTDAATGELLGMIETSAQRGAGIIRQILSFVRGTTGEKVLVQIRHLLAELRKMMEETFPPSIQFKVQAAKDLQSVSGNPTELYQLILNLCVNARDAMPGGGTITLAAANIRLDETCARLSKAAWPGDFVLVTVADTGGGISPEDRERIFEPFFTTKEVGKGTGLGLSTVKDIVASHGGFIHFYSEVGAGTQFNIYLPAIQVDEPAAGAGAMSIPVGNGELVLVVDDEAAVREIVKITLETYGYRVVTAKDGTEAVARFVERLKEVRLLFTDIQMPHMDGMATIRALRGIQPGLRVIAASGLTTHQDALKATDIKVQGFVAKPYTATSLLLALDAALHPN